DDDNEKEAGDAVMMEDLGDDARAGGVHGLDGGRDFDRETHQGFESGAAAGRNRDRDTDEFELLHRGDQGGGGGYREDADARDEVPVSPVQQSPRRVRGDEETAYEPYRGQALGVAR
ncbi:hypothetical protein V494_07884, partial [Pseudogymnoascus sp. VKM F-4513 (FW-928)]